MTITPEQNDDEDQPAMHHGLSFKCLDHGYVTVRDWMGSDYSICQSARTSYQKGTKTVSDDRTLIRYLIKHAHSTPIEMAVLIVEIKLPIFVARQFVRHRASTLNEVSARYSELPAEYYIPRPEDLGRQSKSNKQGRDTTQLDELESGQILSLITEHSKTSFELYDTLLGKDTKLLNSICPGKQKSNLEIARELARMVLPVNTYTNWVWKIDARNLLNLLKLRLDTHAQYEIRVYAQALAEIVKVWLPFVWEAFVDYELEAVKLSKQQFEFFMNCLDGKLDTNYVWELLDDKGKPDNLTKREYDELRAIIGDR